MFHEGSWCHIEIETVPLSQANARLMREPEQAQEIRFPTGVLRSRQRGPVRHLPHEAFEALFV